MTSDQNLFADIPDPIQVPVSRALPSVAAPALPSPTRDQIRRRRVVAVVVGLTWIALLAAYIGVRPDLFHAEVALQIAAWTLAIPVGLAVALRPDARGWPPGVQALRFTLLGVTLLFTALALLPVQGPNVPLTLRTTRWCASYAVGFALPSLVGAAIVLRRSLVNAPTLRGALVGAVIGLAGSTGIHAHCPVVTPSHVIVAHGFPILVLSVVFAVIGRFLGRP